VHVLGNNSDKLDENALMGKPALLVVHDALS